MQAVFQDSSTALSPRRRIRDIIAEPMIVAGMPSGPARDQRIASLLTMVGLDRRTGDCYPHELSGGMRQRAAIAQALATNPAVIILDEPVSALDVSVRAQILNLLKDIQDLYGVSYVLIAHDLATVRYLSHEVAAMYLGSVMERAPVEGFFRDAVHPCTLALLSAAIPRAAAQQRPIVLSGKLPSSTAPPPGCAFQARCWLRRRLGDPARCATAMPPLRTFRPGHEVACHFAGQSAASSMRGEVLGQLVTAKENAA